MACVINVVERYAIQLRPKSCRTRSAEHSSDCRAQGPMFALEQFFIRGPRRFVEFAPLGAREEIAAFQRKGAAFAAFDPSPERIFPVRGVQRHFPDIVAARARTPGCLARRHTFYGLFEIRSMPGLFFISFIQESEH